MNREKTYSFIIDQDNQSTRIDSVLSLLLPDTSRSFIQKLIEDGNLTVNGKNCTKKKYLIMTLNMRSVKNRAFRKSLKI